MACGIDASDHAWCWGFNADGGLLGSGNYPKSYIPIKVAGGHTFTKADSSLNQNTCAIDTAGNIWCWGFSDTLAFGAAGLTMNSIIPVMITGGHTFTSLAVSDSYDTFGVDSSGIAWGLGYNSVGEIGDGTTTARNTNPVSPLGNHLFKALTMGYSHTCGVLASGSSALPVNYWLSTTAANSITAINKIISVAIIQSPDNANAYIKWLVSFDNWATCKTWDSTNSVWVAAANCSAASATNTSDDIIQGLHNYEFASGAGSLDFKAVLYNTDGVTIPDIDQVVVNYY